LKKTEVIISLKMSPYCTVVPPQNKMQAMVNFIYADELSSIPVLPSSDLLPQKEYGGLHNGQTIA
jgi:hypothetical protein